jgi:hypothetical protein
MIAPKSLMAKKYRTRGAGSPPPPPIKKVHNLENNGLTAKFLKILGDGYVFA